MRPRSVSTRNLIRICSTFISLSICLLSCKKLVDVAAPDTQLTNTNVYSTDETAIAAMNGVYTHISASYLFSGGITSMSLFPGLSADELNVVTSGGAMFIDYYTNNLSNTSTGSSDFWNNIYPLVYDVNSIITGLNGASGLTPAIKKQLMGEAEFMRAFFYFYLVNLYSDVPLIITTNYAANAIMARTPQAQVWQQIISDLKDAESLLSPNYLDGTLLNVTTTRVRPTKWSALALLARVYLYTGDWSDAESQADSVLSNSGTFNLLMNLNDVFLKDSAETIWELQPVNSNQNTQEASFFILSGAPNFLFPVYLDSMLVNAFEPGDQRKVNWVDSVIAGGTYYYAYKYKAGYSTSNNLEDEVVFRLAEQFLIRAEARARQGNIANALIDLNTIRNRAGLSSLGDSNESSLLLDILHERQVELFTEWGHRWLDLKRYGVINSVMGSPGNECSKKSGTWDSAAQLYPIPLFDLQHDVNLLQNTGY